MLWGCSRELLLVRIGIGALAAVANIHTYLESGVSEGAREGGDRRH